jgi:hypothetical protein
MHQLRSRLSSLVATNDTLFYSADRWLVAISLDNVLAMGLGTAADNICILSERTRPQLEFVAVISVEFEAAIATVVFYGIY